MAFKSKYTGNQIENLLDSSTNKQDKLVSGTNIKTINGESLLGSGDITIEGGTGGSSSSNGEDIRYFTDFTVEDFVECAKHGDQINRDPFELLSAAKNNKLICVPYQGKESGFVVASYKYYEYEGDNNETISQLDVSLTNDGVTAYAGTDYWDGIYNFNGYNTSFSTPPIEYIDVDDNGDATLYLYDNGVYYINTEVNYLHIDIGETINHGSTIRFTSGESCTLAIGAFAKWTEGVFPTIEPYITYELSLTMDVNYEILLVLTPFKYSE